MNVSTNTNSPFPDQVVSEEEKATLAYGLQVSRAIEQEWFNYGGAGSNRYAANWNNFHNLGYMQEVSKACKSIKMN